MLVYIRESEMEKIICNVDETDIAEHVSIRLKTEQEEAEQIRKEKAEAYKYTNIKVALDEDLHEQIGKHLYFDLVDHDKVRCFRSRKQYSFSLVMEKVAKELGIPVEYQRFWLWRKRPNHTYRPDRPFSNREKLMHVAINVREAAVKCEHTELKLFLEVEIGQDFQPTHPPKKTMEDIMLFFKLYDPLKEELRYVGRLFVKQMGKPVDILSKLNELAGFEHGEEIDLIEEVQFEPNVMFKHIDKELTFQESELEDGDIVCFQKVVSVEDTKTLRYPNVQSFLEHVRNRQN